MAASPERSLSQLPTEIVQKILSFCSVEDFNNLKCACKRFADILSSEHFWQMKWPYLLKSSGVQLTKVPLCTNSQTSYFSCAQRLLNITYRHKSGFLRVPVHCGLDSKCDVCLQEGDIVSLDIGSKTTWVVTPHGSIQRHPTVLIFPANETGLPTSVTCLICNRRQKESEPRRSPVIQPLCNSSRSGITCYDESRQSKLELDWKKTLVFHKPVPFSDLWLELPFLYILHTANIKFSIFQPMQCFSNAANIDCLKIYIDHVLSKFLMMDVIRKPNSSLIFCEPHNCPTHIRWKLCVFFFENLQVNRLCFLSKGMAVSYLLSVPDCLVIDSGASNTVVYVIMNEKVQTSRTQHCPVGGLNIAKDLYVTLQFSGIKKKVYGPSLDSSRLKRSCYLALNPTLEQKKVSKQKVFVRFLNRTVPSCEVDVLQMGTELFLAPEVHYTAQDLPQRIRRAVDQLPPSSVQLLLSNIVLTGSNTELRGFSTRLTSDLQKAFPEFRNSIRLRTHRGGHSWDAGIGAMNAPLEEKNIGSVFWVSREEYILKGPDVFPQEC